MGHDDATVSAMVDLSDLAEQARSRDEFIRFLDAFRSDLRTELARPADEIAWGAGRWGHVDLAGFLEALESWLASSARPESMARGTREQRILDGLGSEAWQAFAWMLLAARVHE
jgi:hypothetical protein